MNSPWHVQGPDMLISGVAPQTLKEPVAPADSDDISLRVGFREWATVLVLTILILLSFVDRSALSLVASSVKADLRITNVQLSYLLGTSFALFYSVVGLPCGYLVDRYNRRWIMFGAVVLWSAMTMLCGIAESFSVLFIGRLGVGLGEAAVSPVAFSIIRDAFPARLRARAMSFFYIGSACGSGAALLLVGALLSHIPAEGLTNTPLLGSLRPWQVALTVIGFSGLPISLLIWTMRDPSRRHHATLQPPATMQAALTHFLQKTRIYIPLFIAYGFSGIGSAGSNSWAPTYIIQAFHLSVQQTGARLGGIGVLGALFGMLSSGYVLDRLAKARGLAALPVAGACTLTVAAGCWFCVQYVTELPVLWALLFVASFLTPWGAIAGAVTLSRTTPGAMIGKYTAVYFLIWNLLGYGLGPTLVAECADHFGNGHGSLGHALSLASGGAFLVAAMLMLLVSAGLSRADTRS